MKDEQIAGKIACLAYQKFEPKPDAPIKEWEAQQFEMYNYNRIANIVIRGMVLNMLERGFTEEEAIKTLRSKDVRYTLDRREDDLLDIGRDLANSFSKPKNFD